MADAHKHHTCNFYKPHTVYNNSLRDSYMYFYPNEAILQKVLQEFISVISEWITSYPPCG